MNKSIRLTAVFSLVLVAILLVNLTVIQAFSTEKYAHNGHNRRGFLETATIARGQIYAGGTVLAQSTANAEGFYTRSYPETSPAFSDVTGYLSDQFGAAGLEASHNDILNGKDDTLLARSLMDTLTGKQPAGANVEVTIDPALQQTAYDQLSSQGYNGAAVAIQPSTGKILAMASSPSYSSADVTNPETGGDTWSALQNQAGNPLINHATQDTLPPGSIFKIITTAAGLNNGFTPSSTLTGQNEITLPDNVTTLTNYGNQMCGGSQSVTLETAFALSCNTAFVQMETQLEADQLGKYADAFGVAQDYNLGVETSAGNLGDLTDDTARAQSSIGQRDVAMSALQAAVMAGTIANKGVRMTPYLVNKITDAQMNDIRVTQPKAAATAVSEDVATTITNLMRRSEQYTYGYDGNGFASKTGTAEHGEGLAPHTWYVAFDPDKDIAVAVVVKDGGHLGENATGGQVSSPIGRAILRAYTGGAQ